MTNPALLSMLTDYGIALEALFYGIALLSMQSRATQGWGLSLLAIALAAMGGGTVHGFSDRLPDSLALVLWTGTLYSLGVASTLMLVGTAFSIPRPRRPVLMAIAGGKAALYLARVTLDPSFTSVAIDHLATLLVLLLVLLNLTPPQGSGSFYWVGIGGAIAGLATGILRYGTPLVGDWAEACYHLVQMGTLYCLYRGARLLRSH